LRDPLGFALGSQDEALAEANRLTQRRVEILNQLKLEAEKVTAVVERQTPVLDDNAATAEATATATQTLAKAERDLLTTYKSDVEADRRLTATTGNCAPGFTARDRPNVFVRIRRRHDGVTPRLGRISLDHGGAEASDSCSVLAH
jgi:hypothetical protein